jgi:hypothetical protein
MLLWGTTGQLVHDLTLTLAQAGYVPRVLESDAQLATEHVSGVLLLAEELLSIVVDWSEMITRRTAGLRAQS